MHEGRCDEANQAKGQHVKLEEGVACDEGEWQDQFEREGGHVHGREGNGQQMKKEKGKGCTRWLQHHATRS
jgi:hypothetical protein